MKFKNRRLLFLLGLLIISANQFVSHAQGNNKLNPWDGNLLPNKRIMVETVAREKMTFLIIKPINSSDLSKVNHSKPNLPVLVFLKGFLPLVGIQGYFDLFAYLAAKGITVIAPIYKPDLHYGSIKDLTQSKEFINNGFDSKQLANKIGEDLGMILQNDYQDRALVIYGHSLGAVIALSLVKTLPYETSISALVLDGLPSRKDIKDTYHFDEVSYDWDCPVTFFHFGLASKFNNSPQDEMYGKISVPFKQVIAFNALIQDFLQQSQSSEPDHFSPYSTDPANDCSAIRLNPDCGKFANIVRTLGVYPEVEKIHGYKPRLITDVVDEYSVKTLLPALAFAHSEDSENKELAMSLLYGENRTLSYNQKPIRSVLKASSKKP